MITTELISLETQVCCTCGVLFALPDILNRKLKENGRDFFCPNGHSQHYCETDVMKLQRLLDAKERELRESKCETLRERQAKESQALETLKAQRRLMRVQKGVCPCCNRSFANLRRHMETKHPEATTNRFKQIASGLKSEKKTDNLRAKEA